MTDKTLSIDEVFNALNELRSNVVATQSASWSNTMYPLVAILNAAGIEQFDSSEEQMNQHMHCYGGAGGYPGNILDRERPSQWYEPVGRLRRLERAAQIYLNDPTDKTRAYLESQIGDTVD